MKVACAVDNESGDFKKEFPDLIIIGSPDNVPDGLDLLILTGGEDINPNRYGEPNMGADGWSDDRDELEFRILEKVINKTKAKVLGVCRGMQLLAVYMGCSLHQNVFQPPLHKLIFSYGDSPFSWLKVANSLHHQAVRRVSGSNCVTHAIDPETRLPEIITWDNRYLGVQFHPEMFHDDPRKKFFGVVRKWVNYDFLLVKKTELKTVKLNPARYSISFANSAQELANQLSEQPVQPNPESFTLLDDGLSINDIMITNSEEDMEEESD